MSPEQQRIKIAEACGWTNISLMPYGSGSGTYLVPKGYKDGIGPTIIPHYLKDLNAMHEAEKTLEIGPLGLYLRILADQSPYNGGHSWTFGYAKSITATAAQRAEAFLRTLNLWTE